VADRLTISPIRPDLISALDFEIAAREPQHDVLNICRRRVTRAVMTTIIEMVRTKAAANSRAA